MGNWRCHGTTSRLELQNKSFRQRNLWPYFGDDLKYGKLCLLRQPTHSSNSAPPQQNSFGQLPLTQDYSLGHQTLKLGVALKPETIWRTIDPRALKDGIKMRKIPRYPRIWTQTDHQILKTTVEPGVFPPALLKHQDLCQTQGTHGSMLTEM